MTEPIWLSIARAFIGIAEIPGAQSAAVILRWARDIGAPAWYDNDDKAWCAVFANRVLQAAQIPLAGTGYELLRARTFAVWGQVLAAPALGALLVFERPEGGHVGFYLGERGDLLRVLGGNQGNAVSETWIPRSRLVAIRWPAGLPLPSPSPVTLEATGDPVSQNEA